MIRKVSAFMDSVGVLYATQIEAEKAEFRRLLTSKFTCQQAKGGALSISVDVLVDGMDDLVQVLKEASKEAPPSPLWIESEERGDEAVIPLKVA